MVQDVEVFAAELEHAFFIELEFLEQRKIQIGKSGARNNVAAGISVLLRQRIGERRWIEPLIDALLKPSRERIADQVRTKIA